jgi:hypothetical protein
MLARKDVSMTLLTHHLSPNIGKKLLLPFHAMKDQNFLAVNRQK